MSSPLPTLRAGFRTRFRREKAEGRGQAEAERRRRIPTGDTPRSDNEGMVRPSAFVAETRVLKPALKLESQAASPFESEFRSAYSGKKVLITGGMGFIGSNLAIRLSHLGAQVTLLDSLIPGLGGDRFNIQPIQEKVRWERFDLRDSGSVVSAVQEQEVLFNLAAQVSHVASMQDPLTDLEINVRSQIYLLEACRQVNPKVRIVHVSTRHVYGKAQYLPVDERHPLNPMDVYSVHKLAGEQLHRLYAGVHGLKVCVLRLTTTYGPRQNGLDFIGVFFRRVVQGKPLIVFGEGLQQRDFLHVDDACEALLLAGCRKELLGELYNLGGSEHLSIMEFAKWLGILSKVPVEKIPFPPERKAIEIGDFIADDTKFREAAGWTPRVPLEAGMRKTYAYFHAHRNHYLN